jgi:hypothetical protein
MSNVIDDPACTILANGQPATLVEVIDHEARSYRAWETPIGDFLAGQMERIAQLVRWAGATTPAEHEERMEIWESDLRQQWFDRGYAEGIEAARRAMMSPWPE